MLDQLFNSNSRVKILSLLFRNEGKKFYTHEIIKLTELDPANAQRELVKLVKLALISGEKKSNRQYYYINNQNQYFSALKELFDIYSKLEANDQWFMQEEFPSGFPVVCVYYMNVANLNNFFKSIGIKSRLTKTIAEYKNDNTLLFFLKAEFNKLATEVVDAIKSKPEFYIKLNQEVFLEGNNLFSKSKKLLKTNLSSLANKELLSVANEIFSAYETTHVSGWPQNVADFEENLFSKYLMAFLQEAIQKTGQNYKASDVFVKLTSPVEESNAQKEYKNLLIIMAEILRDRKTKKLFLNSESRIISRDLPEINLSLSKKIDKHAEEYGYLGFGFVGPVWDRLYYVDILASLMREGKNPEQLKDELGKNKVDLANVISKINKDLKIDSKHQKIFKVARGFLSSKAHRKDSMFYFFWAAENLFKEIAKRFYLSLKQVRQIYPREYSDLLMKNKFDTEQLDARFEHGVSLSTGNYQKDKILIGKEAQEFMENLSLLKDESGDVEQLNGQTASPGKVRGIVKIINKIPEMTKMEIGDVLVSVVTTPELVPAMKKAAAIVTDVGGITSHAAIVSRELGTPCIVGTKIATKALHDGDLVDVDASHGKLIVIKRKTL